MRKISTLIFVTGRRGRFFIVSIASPGYIILKAPGADNFPFHRLWVFVKNYENAEAAGAVAVNGEAF